MKKNVLSEISLFPLAHFVLIGRFLHVVESSLGASFNDVYPQKSSSSTPSSFWHKLNIAKKEMKRF